MPSTAVPPRRRNRRCSAAIQCRSLRTVITARIAARPCQRYALLLCSLPPCLAFATLLVSWQCCQRLANLSPFILSTVTLRHVPTCRQSAILLPYCHFASRQS